MRTRVAVSLLALFVGMLGVAVETEAQMGVWETRSALTAPVIDGVGIVGLQLGWDEASAMALLGPPQSKTTSPLGDRALTWEPLAGLHVIVRAADGRITAIGLSTAEDGPGLPVSTARGVALGAPVTVVGERYGDAPDGRLWYAAEGIAFNVEGPAPEVHSIFVFARGTAAP